MSDDRLQIADLIELMALAAEVTGRPVEIPAELAHWIVDELRLDAPAKQHNRRRYRDSVVRKARLHKAQLRAAQPGMSATEAEHEAAESAAAQTQWSAETIRDLMRRGGEK